jgi:outer membrane protein OmpA-like peptidoglycan-associated protein/chromosome segregation ATPase
MPSKIQTLLEALKSLREFINSQQTQINALETRTDYLEQQQAPVEWLKSMRRLLNAVQKRVEAIEKRTNHLEQQQQSAVEILKELVENLKPFSNHFFIVEEYFESLQLQKIRFEVLEKSVKNLEIFNKKLKFIDNVTENLKQQQTRLNVLENRTVQIEQAQTRFEVLEKQQQTRLNVLENRTDKKEQAQSRFEGLENLKQQQTRLNVLENRTVQIEQAQTRFEVLENLKQQQTRLNVLENRTAQIEQAQTRFEVLENLEQQQTQLNVQQNRADDSLEQIQTRLLVLEKFTDNLEQQLRLNVINKINDDFEQLQTRLKPLEKPTEGLEKQQTQLDAFKEHLEKIHDDFEQLQTYLEPLEKRTEGLEKQQTQLDAFKEHLEKIHDDFEQLQTYLEPLEKRTEGLEKQQTQLDAFKEHLENLEQIQIKELVYRVSRVELAPTRLNNLETQLNDVERRIRETAKILPQAIRQASQPLYEQSTNEVAELTESLQKPVEYCIRQSISEDTRPFAEALFPVIGPAIRKSINESFKSLIQSINKSLEQSLSWQGLSWRIEAWRSGRPFSDIVLQHTLVYRVEQVFLIHRETGLLIQHLYQDSVETTDSDAISAMFTAIQDFTRDSFSASKTEELDSVEIGEYTVWLERGPYAVLACVIRGVAPYRFRNIMRSTLESLHARYGTLLRQFSGDSVPLQPCRPLLEKTLQSETKSERKNSIVSLRLIAILGIILLTLIGWGYFHFEYQQRLTNYIHALQKAPGIVVISTKHQDGKLMVYGMRDPLADDPQQIAQHYHLSDDDIDSQWTPYLDLTTPFVELRARQRLEPPPTVSVRVQGDVLHLTGHASHDWIEKATSTDFVAGINHLEINELLSTTRFLLAQAKRELAPPKGVTMTVQERILRLVGFVDSTTYKTLLERIQNLPISKEAFAGVDSSGLKDAERERDKLIQRIEKTKLYFYEGVAEFTPGQKTALQALYKNVQQLLSLSQALDQPVRVQIIGNTDGRGSKTYNQQLAQQRAEVVLEWLHSRGIEKDKLTGLLPPKIRFGESEPNPKYRKVNFKISTDE